MYLVSIWNGSSVKTLTTTNFGKVETYRKAFEAVLTRKGLVPKVKTRWGIWCGSGGPAFEVTKDWRAKG